jgi:hypothetical protein
MKTRIRRGMASLWAIVTLTLLGLLVTLITAQFLALRRSVDRRQHQVQAMWLARSGMELATNRLLINPANYDGETVELIPDTQVRITLDKWRDSPDTFLVTCEARCPKEGLAPIVRSFTRKLKRIEEKEKVHIEVLSAEAATP